MSENEDDDDLDYFTARHRIETERAAASIEPSARVAHRGLAELHRKKAGKALARRVGAAERDIETEPAS